jgi:coatomer protein complex subunit gamma
MFGFCQIRIACKLVEEEDSSGGGLSDSPLFDFIESCLRHKSEMVIYEAAHAIVNLRRTTSVELAPAVSVLQLFCSSPKPTLRFAAVRTLNKVRLCHVVVSVTCILQKTHYSFNHMTPLTPIKSLFSPPYGNCIFVA